MNDNSLLNFFTYMKDGSIKRLSLNRNLQQNLSEIFRERLIQFIPKERDNILNFSENIHYKPDENEIFVIKNFNMMEDIIDAVNNPISIENILENDYENIKAIFCGKQLSNGDYKIMFTTFDSRKIIKSSRLKTILIYRNNTFTEFENKMIVINDKIDVLFANGNLYFNSFINAKRIFGDILNKYYREATDEEIEEFSNELFDSDIPEDFIDYRVRKLIFGIMKSGTPEIQKVIRVGREKFGIELDTTEKGKLLIPDNKKEFKRLLKLLNDDLLESPLTDAKYETNSKRRIG